MFLSVGVFWQLSSGLLDTALALSSPCICRNFDADASRTKPLLLKAVEDFALTMICRVPVRCTQSPLNDRKVTEHPYHQL